MLNKRYVVNKNKTFIFTKYAKKPPTIKTKNMNKKSSIYLMSFLAIGLFFFYRMKFI